jgi:phosphoribosylaminoimidazole-succinocarboxamide synthase
VSIDLSLELARQKRGIDKTHLDIEELVRLRRGKVRDVYELTYDRLVVVATDRISAFDHVLPQVIPYKGEILNLLAARGFEQTRSIVPNWLQEVPDPAVSIGRKCEPIPVEFVVRAYLCGHAARLYEEGHRRICGQRLPDGLRRNDPLPEPLLTPTTKAQSGHDEDISPQEIVRGGLLSRETLEMLTEYALALFDAGTRTAQQRGLIMADTKYEFGTREGRIYLIDEVHTPDSSRFFYAEGFEEKQERGEPQHQLSKEFVREWLMEQGFQGLEGQQIPPMSDETVASIQERYFELYRMMTGQVFHPSDRSQWRLRLQENTTQALKRWSEYDRPSPTTAP